ncbi:uncharacterized protein TNCV_4040541 [Trichonephila clavipes]|nr:uncharacterized protein TNCV_4040541 [Trichonephila clavipes]
MDPIILNFSQVTRTTSEQAPPLQTTMREEIHLTLGIIASLLDLFLWKLPRRNVCLRDVEEEKKMLNEGFPCFLFRKCHFDAAPEVWTATAGSDVLQSGRPIFDDFFQHLRPYIGNNAATVVFQMVKRLWLIRRPMTLHSPTENSLAVLNHKILEANSQVRNVKLGGHQTCLSINRLWHELCDMLRRLVETTAPGHHDCSIQE